MANRAARLHLLFLPLRCETVQIPKPPCDVFIPHRGVETKRNVAGLLHEYLGLNGLSSFLDCKTLMPGQRLSYEIRQAVHQCKVGVPIFSPRYCESWHCMYELALLTESGKGLVPIFWDIEPSQLQVPGHFRPRDVKRFASALDKARDTVGITFNSSTGDWAKLLGDTHEAVQSILL
ncbi:hypothetical protein MLD38_016826 [Melastoma candidum]|uniref:Uncharacterized protein n=1 Tax=Melastoma candidum TaxID=119954 RepID=A0ACB9QNU1_9MYRT|nr:hypothetical protein MLD38_016826 [Melastoma candidum]